MIQFVRNRRGDTMRSDSEIKRDVERELHWDPEIRSDAIAVAVKEGTVSLTGFMRSYRQKRQAEAVAKRVEECRPRCRVVRYPQNIP